MLISFHDCMEKGETFRRGAADAWRRDRCTLDDSFERKTDRSVAMAATRTVPGAAPSGPLTKAQRRAAAQQSTAAPLAHKGQDPNAVVVADVKSKVGGCVLWPSGSREAADGWMSETQDEGSSSNGRPDKAKYDAGEAIWTVQSDGLEKKLTCPTETRRTG